MGTTVRSRKRTEVAAVIVIHPGWREIAALPAGHLRCPSSGAIAHTGLFSWVWAPGISMAERVANHGPDGGRWQLSTAPPGSERREAVLHRMVMETGEASLAQLLYRVPLTRLDAVDDAITAGIADGKALLREDGRERWSRDYRDEAVRRAVGRRVRRTLDQLLDTAPTMEAAA